jgi:NIMA (never in mitosis gene a)-related kinase
MEGLYNKVIKGHYPKIGDRYSSDISEIIKMLLKVNPSDRPTCAQILKHPIIKKRLEFFKSNANFEDIDNIDEGVLLQTIRIPKNVLFLADRLPGSNYNKKKNDKNLPDIKFTEGNESNNNNNNKKSNNMHMKLNSVSKSVVQKENNNNNNYNSENLTETKKNDSQEQSKIIKDQKIKILKEEEGLPNLEKDKVDINPINSQRKSQLQKRAIQNKKELEYQKYLQNLGLGDIYKVNYLNLGNNNGNRVNKQQRNRYGNYLPGIYKNKRNNSNSYSQNYNSNNSNNVIINKSPRIIPNKRLNPINKGLGIKILY